MEDAKTKAAYRTPRIIGERSCLVKRGVASVALMDDGARSWIDESFATAEQRYHH